jgi:hypothetical protein
MSIAINYDKILYDNIYNIIVVMILMQIFASLIINQFGHMDEATESREKMLTTQCFVCGESKASLEEQTKDGYLIHIQTRHSLWMYLSYTVFLKRTKASLLDYPERRIRRAVIRENTTWIPLSRNAVPDDDD